MYSTCLFCSAQLGSNDAIEQFPVGRRIAFDAARGRLWVVCRKCERWNLSPLEERWEAIETCERRFRDTRLRVSTDNIGLARVGDGLELVRIGAALRPEFAAWRYGDQFGRRRRRHLLYTGAGVTAGIGILVAGPVLGLLAGSSWAVMNIANTAHNVIEARRVRVRLRVPERDRVLPLRRRELMGASLLPGDDAENWLLRIPLSHNDLGRQLIHPSSATAAGETILSGRAALEAAGQLLPHLNARGAPRQAVQRAVRLVEDAGDAMRLFGDQVRPGVRLGSSPRGEDATTLNALPVEVRLALEMAAHEEAERRAMEGELTLLEAAWREAEEIAAIADELLVPTDVEERIERSKSRRDDSST